MHNMYIQINTRVICITAACSIHILYSIMSRYLVEKPTRDAILKWMEKIAVRQKKKWKHLGICSATSHADNDCKLPVVSNY